MKNLPRPSGILSSPTLLIALLCFTLLVLYNAFGAFMNARGLSKERDTLKTRVMEREKEIAELQEKLHVLSSGEGLELEARSRLNLQKPDERVVIIVDGKEKKEQTEPESSASLFAKVKKWFLPN